MRLALHSEAGADPVLWGLRCPAGTTVVCQNNLSNCEQLKLEMATRGQETKVRVLRMDGVDRAGGPDTSLRENADTKRRVSAPAGQGGVKLQHSKVPSAQRFSEQPLMPPAAPGNHEGSGVAQRWSAGILPALSFGCKISPQQRARCRRSNFQRRQNDHEGRPYHGCNPAPGKFYIRDASLP